MSQLTKSLEKRIQELTASIDAQKTELAAYQHVLHMELSKGAAPSETSSLAEDTPSEASPVTHQPPVASEAEASHAPKAEDVTFKGNKTSMVADIVKSYGSTGASPKDVDAFFTAKKIARSKNLVYNTLSYLVAHKKLVRRDGKYFAAGIGPAATKKKTAAPAAATPTKRKLSPEGLQRIKDALKKRWADKRAAEATASKPATKKATKKK